jgi:hypothetical protein
MCCPTGQTSRTLLHTLALCKLACLCGHQDNSRSPLTLCLQNILLVILPEVLESFASLAALYEARMLDLSANIDTLEFFAHTHYFVYEPCSC